MGLTSAFLPTGRQQHLPKEAPWREKSRTNVLIAIPMNFNFFLKEGKYLLWMPSQNRRKARDEMCLWFIQKQTDFISLLCRSSCLGAGFCRMREGLYLEILIVERFSWKSGLKPNWLLLMLPWLVSFFIFNPSDTLKVVHISNEKNLFCPSLMVTGLCSSKSHNLIVWPSCWKMVSGELWISFLFFSWNTQIG